MNLKQRRVLANLTRTELASMLCVHPNTISKWENGTQKISKNHEAALDVILNPFSKISVVTLTDEYDQLIARIFVEDGELKAIVKDGVKAIWE